MRTFHPEELFTAEKCTRCGICSMVCPASAVLTGDDGRVKGFSRMCIGCGHCGCYCPANCFSLEPADSFFAGLPGEDRVLRQMAERRSVRHFQSNDIKPETLDQLLRAVGYSPTGRNSQGIRVTVINGSSAVRRKIVMPVVRLVRILDCCRLLSLMAGPSRGMVRKLASGTDLLAWGAPCVLLFSAPRRNVTGTADALIAASMVAFHAESMGMGTLWNGVVRILAPFLGLGRSSAVLCVGYPALRKRYLVPPREWKRRDIF